MKESNLSFADGFDGSRANRATAQGAKMKAFDFDKAAEIIKEHLYEHPDLIAEAGLQGDWNYTGGVIFENGVPDSESYTYLASLWATPTLILSWDGIEQMEIPCHCEANDRFNSDSKWDDQSLKILNS